MNPLQALSSPHRPPISPKRRLKARHGVASSSHAFTLPAIQQFEPVLASSPKSYMAANTNTARKVVQNVVCSSMETAVDAGITSPAETLQPPRRPKSRDGVVSPRASRPQPPRGISARADVDIYRYSQTTEQRMAIRPLFQQRRESDVERGRPGSVPRRSQRKTERDGGDTDAAAANDDAVRHEHDQCSHETAGTEDSAEDGSGQEPAVVGVEDEEETCSRGTSVRSCLRTGESSNQDESLGDSLLGTVRSLGSADEASLARAQSQAGSASDCKRASPAKGGLEETMTTAPSSVSEALVKRLEASTCHEPFLQTEGPKLSCLRNAVRLMSSDPVEVSGSGDLKQVPGNRTSVSGELIYKVLAKDLHVINGRHIFVTVLLSSLGDARVTCKSAGEGVQKEEDVVTVLVTSTDLTQSRVLRPDLQILTSKWAEWLLTRVRCNSRDTYYLSLMDSEESERRQCFAQVVRAGGKAITVEMHVLGAADSLLVAAKEVGDSGGGGEIVLGPDEIKRLALSFGTWNSESDEPQEVRTLFNDHEFLARLANESNVFRLGISCASFIDDSDDSLLNVDPFTIEATPSSYNEKVDKVVNRPVQVELKGLGLIYPVDDVQSIIEENKLVAAVAFLAQAYAEDAVLSTLRHFQQAEAIQFNVKSFMHQAVQDDNDRAFEDRVTQNLEASNAAKLRELAMEAIVEDMINDMIAFECRVEIHEAKYSGGYDDHYASKVQATYRMSTHKKSYDRKRHVRMRAARLLQALQRGILARRRYSEMKVEREKYLFYGFRSSLYHTTANLKDPRLRARELSMETERRRYVFLMQVLQGHVATHFVQGEFRVSAQVVQDIYNEFGVVVGCSTSFGDVVASFLAKAPPPALYDLVGDTARSLVPAPPRLFSSSQVSAALLQGLRSQYDDTFGLSTTARRQAADSVSADVETIENAPPRWLLKTCVAFQRANRQRLADLRLTRKAAGQKAAHLVARDYRNALAESLDSFEGCRATWEAESRARREQQRMLDTFTLDELVQHCLDLLTCCVKDWGLDPEPLFEALNLCVRHCHGKAAVPLLESKFDAYASGVNAMHGKRSILSLRDEISQELEDFEKLLAERCLNLAVNHAVSVPTSELLHLMLHGSLDDEYIRHGLPSVLPVASIAEKHALARKMLLGYANSSYGDAFNLICWSCLDVAENVTVEAAQLLDKLTRSASDDKTTLAGRALYLLTGSQSVRFLQFLAKTAHFNKPLQRRVLTHLAPYTETLEMHRLASAVCALDDLAIVSRVVASGFSSVAVGSCAPMWAQYRALFGEERHARAISSVEAETQQSGDSCH